MRKTLVKDVMTRRVIAVREESRYRVIVTAMRTNHVNCVPVLDVFGAVRGVVSIEDLVLKMAPDQWHLTPRRRAEHRKATARTAAELMTAPARTTTPDRPVTEVAEVMRRHHINQLPVVDPGSERLVGIVTRSDLLRVFARTDAEICVEITDEVLAHIPEADRTRIRVAVLDGAVTLRGTVRRHSTVRDVVRAVEDVEGVVHIEERLRWETSEGEYPATPLY